MKNPGRTSGIILLVVGVCLIIGGGLAYIWGIPVTENSWFSSRTYMTYPFREMGSWFIGMGFTSIVFGIVLFALQNYLKKPEQTNQGQPWQFNQAEPQTHPQYQQYTPQQQGYYPSQQTPQNPPRY